MEHHQGYPHHQNHPFGPWLRPSTHQHTTGTDNAVHAGHRRSDLYGRGQDSFHNVHTSCICKLLTIWKYERELLLVSAFNRTGLHLGQLIQTYLASKVSVPSRVF